MPIDDTKFKSIETSDLESFERKFNLSNDEIPIISAKESKNNNIATTYIYSEKKILLLAISHILFLIEKYSEISAQI